ncbi:MAG: hypothetical protein FWC75_01060 [Oscillospiraceae bacterium]|nr:hypothetical protein [Oscillospiraceae bacterium]
MKGYELTSRGIIFVVVLAVVLLFVPATIIFVSARDTGSPAAQDDQTPPTIADAPPEGGDDLSAGDDEIAFYPLPEIPDDSDDLTPPNEDDINNDLEHQDDEQGDDDEQAFDDLPEEPEEPELPEYPSEEPGQSEESAQPQPEQTEPAEQVALDPIAGTLTFYLTSDTLSMLLDPDSGMLDDFLALPTNTEDRAVLIDVPELASETVTALIRVVSDALTLHGVSPERIAYVTRPVPAGTSSYGIVLSYVDERPK